MHPYPVRLQGCLWSVDSLEDDSITDSTPLMQQNNMTHDSDSSSINSDDSSYVPDLVARWYSSSYSDTSDDSDQESEIDKNNPTPADAKSPNTIIKITKLSTNDDMSHVIIFNLVASL